MSNVPIRVIGAVSHNELAATGTNIAATKNGIAPGNDVLVLVTVEDLTTISNVSDGTTTVTLPDGSFDWAAGTQRMAVYRFPKHTGGNFTFTATFAASQPFRGIDIVEVPSVGKCVGVASNTGNGTALSLIPPVVEIPGAFILALAFAQAALTLTGSGWTDLVNDPTVLIDDVAGIENPPTGVPATVTWTTGTSGIWTAFAIAYAPEERPVSAAPQQRAA